MDSKYRLGVAEDVCCVECSELGKSPRSTVCQGDAYRWKAGRHYGVSATSLKTDVDWGGVVCLYVVHSGEQESSTRICSELVG